MNFKIPNKVRQILNTEKRKKIKPLTVAKYERALSEDLFVSIFARLCRDIPSKLVQKCLFFFFFAYFSLPERTPSRRPSHGHVIRVRTSSSRPPFLLYHFFFSVLSLPGPRCNLLIWS